MGRCSIPILGFVLLCFLVAAAGATGGANYLKYKDPEQPLGARIRDLMKRMTLQEKIGQMVQIERSVATPDVMKNYFIGSVLSGGGSVPAPKASPETWVNTVNAIQNGALSTRLGIPMIYGIDAVHGHNNVYNATIFPHNVCRDPRWGRCYESYSEDHRIVQAMTEIIPGLQGDLPAKSRKGVPYVAPGKTKVAACAKHFVGDGGTVKGIDENNTGFVISDWQGIDRITSPPGVNYSYSVEAGVSAGIDMIMIPYNFTQFIDELTNQVKKNIIPMSRIDDAVKRILRVKFAMGLFETPLADLSLANQLGSQEHRELAREAVRKSLVLLKNGKYAAKPLLPLPKKAPKILVAGSHANNLGYQCGGWTITWQGLGGNDLTVGTTILDAVKKTVDPSTQVVFNENPDSNFVKSNQFSYAIVVVGEPPYAEMYGDSSNLTIFEPGPTAINNVCGAVKCVVVVVSGRPVVVQPYLAKIEALVAAWLPGTEGQGVTDVLFGDYGFTGKLARTWFKTVDQLPMNANAEYVKYKDPAQPMNARIKDLMSRMTVGEKIGQMVQLDRVATTPDIVKTYSIGSLLSGGGSVPSLRATPKDWIAMFNGFQNASLSTRLGIPLIYGIDAVHGHNNVYQATVFPHNVGLGATRDPHLVKKIGAATALEVRATGLNYVCRDPRWGRCYESYSEDPSIVKEMTDIILGLQGEIPSTGRKGVPFVGGRDKVAACAKHFVGDGGTTRGINENNTVIDFHGLMSIHMPGYFSAIIKGVSTVMVSYSSWNGEKMHANRALVTDFLKNTLKFRGIDKITSPPHANYTYSVLKGVSAGIDMIMVPLDHTGFIDALTSLVDNNFIPMSRIDDAVRRILRVKFTMGLFENPFADESFVDQLGSQAHRNLAREAVRKSLVLLKNGEAADNPILPLPKKAARILVAGTHADNLGYQCGGWTLTWQGTGGNDNTAGTTILEAISAAVHPSTEIIYNETPDADFVKSKDFSYAIVVVGEPPYAEGMGDSLNLTIPEPGPSTITNVCGNVKCVVVIVSGRPVVIEPYLPQISGLVAAWLPGTEGQGVADVLFGDYGFTGKLPRTWFKTADQLPMNVGDPHYDPLYPFGFGLQTTAR
ncbi:hypothetical protein Tsubulata_035731 [Turnera subulata]|uniref:Beta-glucosidase n=1 Tax=Turnera subulata TaxID=218843 RepID=A0A9Q0JA15_9ROSI|nr:hypothetical protein Tsubulata_035731 [Turnera subulata]